MNNAQNGKLKSFWSLSINHYKHETNQYHIANI